MKGLWSVLLYFVDKLWPVLPATFLTHWIGQWIIEERKPRLEMVPEGDGTGIRSWFGTPENWYQSWRISVRQVKVPWYFAWLNRDTALQCKADLFFFDKHKNDKPRFGMAGRWSNSAQPTFVSPERAKEMFFYPDRIDVGYHSPEPLDCAIQFQKEDTSYGWTNWSYPAEGKVKEFKLPVGEYRVEVKVSGQNFRQLTTNFKLNVGDDWTKTSLSPA